jgi:mRNA interferase RelE/StbE
MNVTFSKRFSKQLDAIEDDSLRMQVAKTVKDVITANNIQDIPRLKKIRSHSSAYRIRIGNYRAGLFIEQGNVLFAVLEHRKDIYKRFP